MENEMYYLQYGWEPEPKKVTRVQSPWRRFCARALDTAFYSIIWDAFLALILHINIATQSVWGKLFDIFAVMLLMLIIEPFLLSRFKTTLGKWILGLQITYDQERKLTYAEAFSRTASVLWYGMGFNIPIYNIGREYKSYVECKDGQMLNWERNNQMTLKDENKYRAIIFVGVYAMCYVLSFLIVLVAEMPRHRGDITVADFCDNYNRYTEYFKFHEDYELNEAGSINRKYSHDMVTEFYFYQEPHFDFYSKNDILTGAQFVIDSRKKEGSIYSYQVEMMISILSFVRAQKNCDFFARDIKDVINYINENPYTDFEFIVNGITVSCDVEYDGFQVLGNELLRKETGDSYFRLVFRMMKE